jgi:hypothetical protein
MTDATQNMDFTPQTPIVITKRSSYNDNNMIVFRAVIMSAVILLTMVFFYRMQKLTPNNRGCKLCGSNPSPCDQTTPQEKLLDVRDDFRSSLNAAAAAYAKKKKEIELGIRHTPTEDLLWSQMLN